MANPALPDRPMQKAPSKTKAALWMSGWLTLTLVMAMWLGLADFAATRIVRQLLG